MTHKTNINSFAISPDGQNLLSTCGLDKTIKSVGLA
ncbi:hypothetical protein [Nostoc sp. FACHB-133]